MTARSRNPRPPGRGGSQRSAEIDRTEADGHPTGSEAAARCLRSAARWEAQARMIEREWLAITGAEFHDG